MKDRLLSLAMALCMVLSLLPATAFADENAETPVCTCEEACTADAMDAECPVCGAEGAVVENCGKYIAPVVEEQVEEVVQMGAPAGEEPELTAVEKVQAMINALPTVEEMEDADDEKVDEVYAAVQDVYDALDELSTEELDQITGLDKLAALMEWFTGPVSTYEGEDYPYLNYTIEDNGTITITGLKDGYKDTTDVTIPAKIGGYDVTAIGGWSFEDCKNITRVNLPASITSIGKNAFKNCTNLESINIPYGVTSIGWYAFAGCTKLASITIPSSVTTIEDGVFQNCTGLTSITIPSSVTRINDSAFAGCTGLTSITIPSSVTQIFGCAFADCTSLTSVTIPSSVTTIEDGVFLNCTGLTSVTIPSSMTIIPTSTFAGCTGLTSITIPNSVKGIGDHAFGDCSGLKDVYYLGTKKEWKLIFISGDCNGDLNGKVKYVGDITQGFSFTQPSNLTYDGNAKEATVTKNNEDYGAFTVKYYNQNGQVCSEFPVDAGTYTVKIDIEASQTYDAISDYEIGRFTILQAENSFTTDLSIEDWTYGDTPKAPDAAAKFGTPTYSYSTEEDGTYTTTQPTNAGTYWVKAVVEGTDNYTGLEAKIQFTILPKTYTVTYAAGSYGTGTVTAGRKTHDVAFTLSSGTFTRAGYEQTGWAATDGGEKVYDLGGTYTANEDITLYPVWSDITKPTGEISIGTDSWTTSPADITFGLFFKDSQTVTITASDNSNEAVTIGYLLSDKALSAGELASATFTTYNGGFTISSDLACVVYVKLTDSSGNVEYISSDGIVLDATAPVISGIEDDKVYCSSQTFTVTETYLDKVTVNDVEVALNGSNQYTLDPTEGTQTIVATDKAGNKAEMTVTVNDGHTYEWQSGNGQYWKKCKNCGDETAKKDIPTITISGADKVCVTQDYKFSFTLPEGTADAVYGYDFKTKGDMGLAAVIENGEPYGVVPAEWYDLNQSSFEVYAGATTADGFEFFVSKDVALLSEHTDVEPKDHSCDVCGAVLSVHTGGKATCKNKAVCEYCGEAYGDLDPDNHVGGEATCTSKAVCEYCGNEYGEINSSNHNLEKVAAKEATVTETGNSEYWHCKDCENNFSDAAGKSAIELKDTVVAKLAPEIIEGKGQSITAGEKKALTFRSNAAFSDFIRVELDGKTLDGKNYTVKEGSTIVTLKADYVATLSAGKHTIGIVSTSGTAATTFTVNKKAAAVNAPKTGDNSHIALWIALLVVSGGLMTVLGVYIKKKKRSAR